MTEEDFNKKLFRPEMGLYFTPAFVLDTFEYYINSFGLDSVLKHRNTKKLKEMWAGATFLLGYQKMTSTEQYIAPCFDTTPDVVYGMYIESSKIKDSHDFALLNIEITEWESRTSQDLLTRIQDKLKDKLYPNDYVLLLHITRIGDLNVNMDKIYDDLKICKLNLQGIWILVGNSRPDVEDNYTCFCVYPSKGKIDFSLSEYKKIDSKRFPQMVQTHIKRRVTDMKIESIKMELPKL